MVIRFDPKSVLRSGQLPSIPVVSIGMPVFNGALFIREALDLILGQTFRDFELIISDNASTDETKAICLEYAARDPRIRYVRQVENLGAIANLQFVLDQAVGEYFMWAAYDDLRSKKFIEILLAGFEDKNVVTSFSKCAQIDSSARKIGDEIILDFSDDSPYKRIRNYWRDRRDLRDILFYGLHRSKVLKCYRLKPWGILNIDNPQNCAHPVITHLLANGQYWFYEDESLFFRRVLEYSSWVGDVTKRTRIGSFISYLLLIYQLHIRVVCVVYSATSSISLTIALLPTFLSSLFSSMSRHLISPIKHRLKNIV